MFGLPKWIFTVGIIIAIIAIILFLYRWHLINRLVITHNIYPPFVDATVKQKTGKEYKGTLLSVLSDIQLLRETIKTYEE